MPHSWQRAAIAGKPAEVFEPPGPWRFALLWLHDEDAAAPPPVLASLLEEHGLACVAPFGGRSWWMVAFFAALGATNLAKGLIFGPAMAGIPMAGYLLLSREPARLRKYFWIWGGLLFALIMFAWPAAVLQRFPDAVQPIIAALPLTALNDALRATMLQSATVAQIAPQLGVLAVWLIVCFPLALKLFRWR